MNPPVQFGSAKLGIDMLSGETALPKGTLRDICNFWVDGDGQLHTRDGSTRLSAAGGAHSLWSPRSQAYALYAQGGEIRALSDDGRSLNTAVVLSGMRPSQRMRYTEHAGAVYFTNGHDIGVFDGASARVLGVEVPDAPYLSTGVGGMTAGRYGVAISYQDSRGEESGLSPIRFEDVAGGGITVTLPAAPASAVAVLVYATSANGDELYLATQMPAGFPSATITDDRRSKGATTENNARMLGGQDITAHGGRLYVSRGRNVWYSEPLAYGRYDPRFNFVPFEAPVLFIEAVADGIYVGTSAGTYFLQGASPKDAAMRLVGPAPIVDDSLLIESAKVGGETDAFVACWLGHRGYCVGTGTGVVTSPQAKRIALKPLGPGSLTATTRGGVDQVIALVGTTAPDTFAAATDSPLSP